MLGKGYILNEERYIVGVGAANVDVHGKSRAPIVMKDSNPGSMHSSVGGVTRNVCENLSRLGTGVKLISAVGDDVYADMIRRECLAAGIDISGVYTVYGHPSSTYISILDEKGDMLVALSDMSEPCTVTPMPCSTSASAHMDTPPMPARWTRLPGWIYL